MNREPVVRRPKRLFASIGFVPIDVPVRGVTVQLGRQKQARGSEGRSCIALLESRRQIQGGIGENCANQYRWRCGFSQREWLPSLLKPTKSACGALHHVAWVEVFREWTFQQKPRPSSPFPRVRKQLDACKVLAHPCPSMSAPKLPKKQP
jgi:hypothetical protein